MLAGRVYMECYYQVFDMVYRNVCAEYGIHSPELLRMTELRSYGTFRYRQTNWRWKTKRT